MKEVIEALQKAEREKFFGNVQIDFREGEAVLIRKTETIKLGTEKNRHENNRY